ncbi:oligopeptidase A [Alteromonas sediminis]|uniref:oligopeptidase A n=1 Tax=Alteromonas sediminis TaxID=2259342 RepID=A0A3N5Z7J8_9ALTE|nr:oligopeptidase A [Alteromonas sediminis]RPJ64798.1 oligopeptidase A [Alteromonas sediminis]
MSLPLFTQIKTDTIVDDISKAIAHSKAVIDEVVQSGATSYEALVLPIEEADDLLSQLWSPVSHMNSVVSSDKLREAHDACLPLLSEYGTWVGQHQGLYQAYQNLHDSESFSELDQAQQKLITNALRDFTLSGVALPDDKKKTYATLQAKLSELGSSFSNNLLDATMGWYKHIEDEALLDGIPESAKAAAKQAAKNKEKTGWVFTLDIPSYLPVMLHAKNRDLREEMYRAYVTRASEQGVNGGKWDNTIIIDETLKLRQQVAQLLGFDNYAERSLASKMAESVEQVQGFLADLAKKSKPQAQKELEEIAQFAAESGHKDELQAWDIPYFSERLKEAKFSITDEELKPYFPEQRVLSGLFHVVSTLYGLSVEEQTDVDVWHKDVRFFTLKDEQGDIRGSFYLDLYARENKRGGAWMDECRVRRVKADGSLQHPVAYLTCNFSGPVGDKPALFTHDEVVTLFHEFGHGIHHMLTKMIVAGVSGINGVPWDAVELPSQFLENWCWQEEALAYISGHYETGEPLPKDKLDKMLSARDFQSAMQMLRQLEFSLFDMNIHQANTGRVDVQAELDKVREAIAVVTPPSFNRFQHSFGHIFAGGYAAGYYSYKWAEVLSSDAFSRFEEEGIFNQQTGRDFLHNILEVGGSVEPMDAFVAFRGREPSVDALLRHNGIAA